jgi:arylsulfatase
MYYQEEVHVMKNDKTPEKSETGAGPTGAGLKRRDLLLSGTPLVAASALSAVGLTSPAQAQQPAPRPPTGQRPNIVFIMGQG